MTERWEANEGGGEKREGRGKRFGDSNGRRFLSPALMRSIFQWVEDSTNFNSSLLVPRKRIKFHGKGHFE